MNELIQSFSNQNLSTYFRSKISSFRPISESFSDLLSDREFEKFTDLKKLGETVLDNQVDELLVFSCKYEGELSSRSSKKAQFDIAKKVLKADFKDGAIFVFYDNTGKFRFSFIRRNYGDSTNKYSTWKRFTYFVEPTQTNRTFRKRMDECSFNTLDVIQEAFSVEKLNEDFYKKIVKSFYSLVGGVIGVGRTAETLPKTLKLPSVQETDKKTHRQFGVRLIGRIIFCWFLKHKKSPNGLSLIPDGWIGNTTTIDNYYHGVLEKLFFEVLNTKQSERITDLPTNHTLIPFLNGGLFEPQVGDDQDFYDTSKLPYLRPNLNLSIPDNWFVELFEFLEQYNFTIDENSVNDSEVSIDPEMLGRIFENLLAEIDPNLEDEEKKSVRKSTGSFYTPREIVDYMAEKALVKYLNNKTAISEIKLHELFKAEEVTDFDNSETMAIIDAFDQVKILDPACGSGAFPMGALHKISLALQKLDPEANIWKDKQLAKITNAAVKADLRERLDKSSSEYRRKLGVIQNSIFGADIQPIAAEISKLRSFLSLIVDENIEDDKPNRGVLELPNLEFKFVTANTLLDLDMNTPSLKSNLIDENIPKLQEIRLDYLQAHGSDKLRLKEKFQEIQNLILDDQLTLDASPTHPVVQLAKWDPFSHYETPWFDPQWMFGEQQFDIIIGNPPYGGTKISDALKTKLGLASKDPYGAFIAKFLRRKQEKTKLKHEGLLAFIVSDTFMTIKSHKELRDLMLHNRLHSMIRVHPDTFKATVNTAIVIAERLEKDKEVSTNLLMADFTNTSIHEQHQRFEELMFKATNYQQPAYEGESMEADAILYMQGENWTSESSTEYAIYTYPQALINTNTNHPFFVANSKLFGLMNDTNAPRKELEIEGKTVNGRSISLNNKEIEVVKLGEIADVKQGLATGDNDAYLYQKPEARGTYRNINEYAQYLLTEADLDKIRNNETLRLAVINLGISKENPESERYFGGRYIAPYDKGGESDSEGGWMPNYYVPTNYFIDWSEWSVNRMKTYTIAQRIIEKNENKEIKTHYHSTCCAVIRSPERYFSDSISFSRTGVYSPTFRFGSNSAFDTEGSMIFQEKRIFDNEILLGLISSKIQKYYVKAYIGHTVHCQVDELKESTFPILSSIEIKSKINLISNNQKQNPQYDYASHEQLEIDALVYQAYGLNWADVREVENWYARRYGRLVTAQKRNLAALGKPTDYLEIYKGILGEVL